MMSDDSIIEELINYATASQGSYNTYDLYRKITGVREHNEVHKNTDRIIAKVRSEKLLDVSKDDYITPNALSHKIKSEGGYLVYLENNRKKEEEVAVFRQNENDNNYWSGQYSKWLVKNKWYILIFTIISLLVSIIASFRC